MILYLNEIGARILQNSGIDLTSVTAKEVTLLKPNGASKTWTGDAVVIVYAPSGSFYVETAAGDLNQTGLYFVQAKFTIGTDERRGPILDLFVKNYLTGAAVDVPYVAAHSKGPGRPGEEMRFRPQVRVMRCLKRSGRIVPSRSYLSWPRHPKADGVCASSSTTVSLTR